MQKAALSTTVSVQSPVKDVIISMSQVWDNKNLYHYMFLVNCLPTPSVSQHFALSVTVAVGGGGGGGVGGHFRND